MFHDDQLSSGDGSGGSDDTVMTSSHNSISISHSTGSYYDYSLVVLTEADIKDDPRVHVDLDSLTDYSRDHLLQWLKFRGDNLKHIDTMKDIRTRVLQYFNYKTDSYLVDPTFEQRYKKEKVARYGIGVPLREKISNMNVIPDILKEEINNPYSTAGWTKDLSNLPRFGTHHIDEYHNFINTCYMEKATMIIKIIKIISGVSNYSLKILLIWIQLW